MDDFPIPGLDWAIIAWAIAGVFAVIIILYLRFRSESAAGTILSDEASFDDPSIEYEWVTEPRVWSRILIVLFFAGVSLFTLFAFEELREVFRSIYQIGIVLLGIISSFLSSGFKKYRYRITSTGLLRSEVGKKGDPKLLFTWKRLAWFSPGPAGFRYHLHPSAKGTPGLSNSGRVEAGDRATLVNAIIMSRGVPTSSPNRRDDHQESRRSFDRSEHSHTSGQ